MCKYLDLVHLKVVLKGLSSFHFSSLTNNGNNNYVNDVKEICNFDEVSSLLHNLEDFLEFADDILEFEKTKEEFLKGLKQILISNVKKSENTLMVVCHGNLHMENILFEYENEVPITCTFSNCLNMKNSPVYDVLLLIYSTTNRRFRIDYFYELLHYYYDCLKDRCLEKNITLNNSYPLDHFLREVYDYARKLKILSVGFKMKNVENRRDKSIVKDCLEDLEEYVFDKSSRFMIEDVYEILRKKLGSNLFTVKEFELRSIGKSNGFLGDHNKLIIKLTNEKNEENMINLFVKFYPEKCAFEDMLVDSNVFHKEIFFYSECISEMKKLGLNIIEECVAACYFTRKDDVLVFEDLVAEGFTSPNQRNYFTVEEMKTVLKTLAKFHSAGMIFEEKLCEKVGKPVNFQKLFPKGLVENSFVENFDRPFSKFLVSGREAVIELADFFYTKVEAEKFKRIFQFVVENSARIVKPSEKYRNTICHGDLWPTNMMIKYENDNPVDTKFVDFQITRYGLPAFDVLFVIFYCVNKKTRDEYLKHFLITYHEAIGQNLKNYSYDPEIIFPFEELIITCDKVALVAAFQVSVWNQFTQAPADVIEEINSLNENLTEMLYKDRRNFCRKLCQTDSNYGDRMKNVLGILKEICECYTRNEENYISQNFI